MRARCHIITIVNDARHYVCIQSIHTHDISKVARQSELQPAGKSASLRYSTRDCKSISCTLSTRICYCTYLPAFPITTKHSSHGRVSRRPAIVLSPTDGAINVLGTPPRYVRYPSADSSGLARRHASSNGQPSVTIRHVHAPLTVHSLIRRGMPATGRRGDGRLCGAETTRKGEPD